MARYFLVQYFYSKQRVARKVVIFNSSLKLRQVATRSCNPYCCNSFCLTVLYLTAFYFASLTLVLSSAPVEAGATFIIPKSSSNNVDHEDYYFTRLLQLALNKTVAEYGPYTLQEYDSFTVDNRLRQTLKTGPIDIIWSNTNPLYECEMRPIGVSLLKDLTNYRLLLIREDDQPRFSKLTNLDQLRKFKGGMGAQWPDTKVMKSNNLPVVTAPGYGKIFHMLAAKRFDYFSRGVFQVQSEVNLYPELNLKIEDHLQLYYPSAFYFFVKRENTLLAQRIETGLLAAQKDGSFDALFNSIPRYQWAMRELTTKKRTQINLRPIDQRGVSLAECNPNPPLTAANNSH